MTVSTIEAPPPGRPKAGQPLPGAGAAREQPSPPLGRGAGGGIVQLAVTPDDRRIARYAAAAIALTVVEAALPSPLPGVKPGLANIVVLIVLARHGWREAVWVSLLRVFAGSLVLGQLLAPGFFLSLAGTVASLAMLALAARLPQRWFGPVSQSILAAFAHIGGQLVLARLWLVPHDGVLYLVPVFAASALLFGIINGLVAAKFLADEARGAA